MYACRLLISAILRWRFRNAFLDRIADFLAENERTAQRTCNGARG
jgi:hypothetical protein